MTSSFTEAAVIIAGLVENATAPETATAAKSRRHPILKSISGISEVRRALLGQNHWPSAQQHVLLKQPLPQQAMRTVRGMSGKWAGLIPA